MTTNHIWASAAGSQETVGLIGLGLMGTALAERLLAAGFAVAGWDVDGTRGAALARIGGKSIPTGADIFSGCERVLLSLPNLDVVAEVLGAVEIRPGQLIIDTTTGGHDQAMAMGAMVAAKGGTYLDATVSGSSAQVRLGEVTVMVGGTLEGFQRAADLLRAFAREVFHVGPCGNGAKMKLVTNLVLGLNRAALAEGLAFAAALGLKPGAALEILQHSMAYSRIMDTKGPKMVAHDFEPQARLSQHLKDVRLMLEAAEKAGASVPLSEVHAELLQQAEAMGLGAMDNSAILRVFEKGEA